MTSAGELHVVFGGNGQVGRTIIHQLIARGEHVRAVNRSGSADLPAGVEMMRAEATDPESARKACVGASVVYHTVGAPYGRWKAVLPAAMDGIIAGAESAGARLVYADNLYMYGKPDGPMREDSPILPVEPKGFLRPRLAEKLLAAHRAGRVRTAIGRASDFYGPAATNAIAGMFVFAKIAAGKRPSWVGSLDVPHSSSYLGDFARGLITLGTRDEALGEVWHIPAAEPLTGREFITLAAQEAGVPPQMGLLTRRITRLAGLVNRQAREFGKTLYQFEHPYVLDGSKFTRAFGGQPTPHREAIRATLIWEQAHAARNGSRHTAPA